MSESLLLDSREVAELLGLHQKTVMRLAETGGLPPPLKLGRLKKWPRSQILDFIRAGRPSTVTDIADKIVQNDNDH